MKPEDAGSAYTGGGDPTAMIMGMMGTMGIIWLVVLAFFIFIWFKIFSKAGFSGWLSLLLIVPLANLILIIWFAFADWPALKGNANAGGVTMKS